MFLSQSKSCCRSTICCDVTHTLAMRTYWMAKSLLPALLVCTAACLYCACRSFSMWSVVFLLVSSAGAGNVLVFWSSAIRPGKGTPSGGSGGTGGDWTGTGGGGAGRDGAASSSDGCDGAERDGGGCGSTDFFPPEVNTGGGISSSLTTCPAWALFRRSSSVLIPRPNLKWKSNHRWFTRFNILPEKKKKRWSDTKQKKHNGEKIWIYLPLTMSVKAMMPMYGA